MRKVLKSLIVLGIVALFTFPVISFATITPRTIVNPANNSSLNSTVMRNELQILENEIVGTENNSATGTITCLGSASCNTGSYVVGNNLTITGVGSAFPFTSTLYGVSTSTTIGLLNGFLSTASSTINANLYLPNLSTGCLSTGVGGVIASNGLPCGSGSGGYPFPLVSNATSTLTNFLGGIGATTISATSTATSTIANFNTIFWVPTDYATNGCAGDPTKTDFGTCVNALNAKLVASGQVAGKIMVPDIKVTQAQWQTPIIFSGPVIVSFDCVQGAQLQYGGTATSTLFNMSNPTGHLALSEDYGCTYMGHSTLIAQGQTNVSTTVGVGFGGSNGAVNINFHDNSINGFGQDIQIGQNAYMISIAHNAVSGGNGGLKGDLLYNDQSSNSGEALTLTDNTWTDPANNIIGNDLYFGNGSLASADIAGKSLDDAQIFIGASNGTVSIHDLHIENSACQTGAYNQYIPILGVSSDQFTHINFNNIEIANDCSGSQTFVTILSHGGQLYASGIHVDNYGGGTITNLVLHSLDNGLEAETVCKVDVASGGLTNIIGGSGAQAYSLAAGNTCISDTSNSYAISIQAHQNNIATIENGSQDVGTFDNNGKWTFLSGINTLSTSATNSIGGSLFGGTAPIAGLGTSNYQAVISQNVNNIAGQLYLANTNTGANAVTSLTFGNANSTNAGASSQYIGGVVYCGPNFATAGFGGCPPNGLAMYNTDGGLALGAISANAASSSMTFYAGNNGSFAGGQPDMVLTGGTANLGLGTTTPTTRFGIQGLAGGSIPMVLISTSTSAYATTTVWQVDKNGNVSEALHGATLTLGTTTVGCLNVSSTGLVYSATCSSGGGIGDPFTHPFLNYSATTSAMVIGTSTPSFGQLTVGSSTAPQLVIADDMGTASWTFRDAGNNLYIATTTVAGTATTTTSALTILGASGNVGIGNSSPSQLLTVGNNNQFTVANTGVVTVTAASNFTAAIQPSANNLYNLGSATSKFNTIYGSIFDGGNNTMVIETENPSSINLSPAGTVAMSIVNGGNVGIGSTTPTAQLGISGVAGSPSFAIGSSTGTQFIVDKNGNVGIGNSAPTALFGVGSTNQFTIDTSGNISNPALSTSGGNSTISTILGSQILGISTNSTLTIQTRNFTTAGGGATTVAMSTGTLSNSSGTDNAVSITPTYNQTGTAAGTDLYINRTETSVGSGAQYLLNAAVGGTSKFVIQDNGNVGIGTTTPGSLLSIGNTGGINIIPTATSTFGSSANGINITNGCYAIGTVCIGAGGSGTVNTGTQGQFPFYNANGTALTATSTIFTSTASNVGISSTTPFAKLSVNAQTGQPLSVQIGTNQVLSVGSSGGLNVGFGATDITAYTNNGALNVIQANGTDENALIQNFSSGLGAYITVNANSNYASLQVQGTGASWKFGEFGSTAFNLFDGTDTKTPFSVDLNTPSNTLVLKSTGNVGIGTTSPTAQLSNDLASSTAGTSQTTPFGDLLGMIIDGVRYMVHSYDYYGHPYTSGKTTTVTGGTSSVSGNDANGTITVIGTALTSVTLNFSKPWISAPDCTESDNSTALTADIISISTTQVVFGFSVGVNSGTVWYNCVGHR